MTPKFGRLVPLIAVVGVLAFPGAARAASGSWFAQGSGTVFNTTFAVVERWQWVATSDIGTPATGAPAKGHFSMRIPGTDIGFDADVTCLNVEGNGARIGLAVRRSTNPTRPVGAQTWITMTSIGHGFDAVHLVGADGSNAVPPVCPPPSGARDPFYGTVGVRQEATPFSWFAQASGTISFLPEQHWQWVAVSDVGGGNARGRFTQRDSSTGSGFSADVACLEISGSSARIGLVITSSTNPSYPAGRATYIHMTTSGQGNNESNALLPDGATYHAVDPITFRPLECPPPVAGGYPFDGTMNIRS